MRTGSPYLKALASPGALRFSAAGILGRLPISMYGLGTVLLISSLTGRYALAGAVAAAGSIGYALVSPLAARLADRRGQGQVLRALALVFALWAMPGLAALTVVIFCSGLGMSPTLISGFSLMEQQAPATRKAEGTAWLTSAISVGTAAGSAAAGQVVDVGGVRWGYAFAAACAAGAVLACVLGLGRLSVASPDLALASADAQT